MKKLVFIAVVCFFAAVPSFADMNVYTDEAAFTALLETGYYLEDWDYDPWLDTGTVIHVPQSFSGGFGWSYDISSSGDELDGRPMPGDGGAVATWSQGNNIEVTFTSPKKPYAVGGIFWVSNFVDEDGDGSPDDLDLFSDGHSVIVTIVTEDGTEPVYIDGSNYPGFTGFVSDSPIVSMTLQSGNFATMDHLYVGNAEFVPVPLPAAVLLGILGLGAVGLKLRKSA
jgi:hypothetical protein